MFIVRLTLVVLTTSFLAGCHRSTVRYELFDEPGYQGIATRVEREQEDTIPGQPRWLERAKADRTERSAASRSLLPATRSAPSFASLNCPPEGNAVSVPHRHRNTQKNRIEEPVDSDFDPDITLDALRKPGDDEGRWSVQSAATIDGYVVDVKVGGVETCNCKATSASKRDTHIELIAEDGDDTLPVIVEVTPRWRIMMQQEGIDWSTPTLKNTLIGKKVRVTGWLFYDTDHADEAENTAPWRLGNWRQTAWEIHPVTGIEILN
jgi:hypothetical protein